MSASIPELASHITKPEETDLFLEFYVSDRHISPQSFTGGPMYWNQMIVQETNAYQKKAKEDEIYAKYDQEHVPIVTSVLDSLGLSRERS